MIEKIGSISDRIMQGDIYKNIDYIEYVAEVHNEDNHEIVTSLIVFPYVIVLTQDCDLRSDHLFRMENKSTQDKYLLSVIVAPLYNAEQVKTGTHLTDIGRKMEPFPNSTKFKEMLYTNEIPRFHYVKFPIDSEIPESIIDFKHYFTVNVNYLMDIRAPRYVCKVKELYRERISQRFSNFLARIGLPDGE